jgi:hypothetical protein
VPAPVSVTKLPVTVAGPLTTEYVMGAGDVEVALTAKGTLPKVWDGIAAKLSEGIAGVTVIVVVADAVA